MAGLLFPAFQKFYSALSNIERFNKEKSFFDNISSLDNFFSEYRNITFVIQKSLAHTPYEDIYIECRDKYLIDRWFVEKRNETIKQQPFRLTKHINTTVYFPSIGFSVDSQTYTVDNDTSLDMLINSIREKLISYNSIEVFFSVKFDFYEYEKEENTIKKCIDGIQAMKNFMDAMYNLIDLPCPLCEELQDKISNFNFSRSPLDMISTIDYVYYPETNEFDRASRISGMLGFNESSKRSSITDFGKMFKFNFNDSFKTFVFINAILQRTDLMTTIMIVYKNGSYTMDMFDASIKTTFYRKINETADIILKEEVEEVYFMMIYVTITSPRLDISKTTSKERMLYAGEEILNCTKVDYNLNEEEYSFIGSQLSDMDYVAFQINEGKKHQLEYGRENMKPIIEAFKKHKEKNKK